MNDRPQKIKPGDRPAIRKRLEYAALERDRALASMCCTIAAEMIGEQMRALETEIREMEGSA